MNKVLAQLTTQITSYQLTYDTKTNKFHEIMKILGGKSSNIEITRNDVLLKLSITGYSLIRNEQNLAKYLPEAL